MTREDWFVEQANPTAIQCLIDKHVELDHENAG